MVPLPDVRCNGAIIDALVGIGGTTGAFSKYSSKDESLKKYNDQVRLHLSPHDDDRKLKPDMYTCDTRHPHLLDAQHEVRHWVGQRNEHIRPLALVTRGGQWGFCPRGSEDVLIFAQWQPIEQFGLMYVGSDGHGPIILATLHTVDRLAGAPTGFSSSTPCRHKSRCYRKNQEHLANFTHPPGHVPASRF